VITTDRTIARFRVPRTSLRRRQRSVLLPYRDAFCCGRSGRDRGRPGQRSAEIWADLLVSDRSSRNSREGRLEEVVRRRAEERKSMVTTWAFEFDESVRRPSLRPAAFTVIEREHRTRIGASLTHAEMRRHSAGAAQFRVAANHARDLAMAIQDHLATENDDRLTTYYPRSPDRSASLSGISTIRSYLHAALRKCVREREWLSAGAYLLRLGRKDLQRTLALTRNRGALNRGAVEHANAVAVYLGRVSRTLGDLGCMAPGAPPPMP
jgi:hypothetical protein